MFKKYKKKILLSAVFGALVFLGFSIYADFDKLLSSLGKFNWYYFPLILAISFLNYVCRFYKWEYYRKIIGVNIKTGRSFLIFLSAFVMSVTPGKMGEVLKCYMVKDETGIPVSKTAPVIVAERLTDFISIVIICIAGAYVFNYGQAFILISGIVFISGALLLSSRRISLKFINALERINFISKYIHKIHESYDSIYKLVQIKELLVASLISLVAWSFECFGFYLVLMIFSSTTHVDVSFLSAFFIYGFSTLVGAIAMLPGGLGATEATITGLLVLLKIPKDVSVASTIIIRVATLWFAVIIGVIAVMIYHKKTHHGLEEIETPEVIV
ncbi:lysylphosphatidylglycerol synthase transmembrane domain-containing protein [soil metagenome]